MLASAGGGGFVSDDETFLLIFSAVIGGFCAWRWYMPVLRAREGGFAVAERTALGFAPIVGLIGVFVMLKLAASADVRDAPTYLLLYSVLGLAWFLAAAIVMEMLGISARDDAVERRNPAAAVVVIGVLLAHAAIYSGANIGNGPGWWTVVAAGGIGSGAWLVMWLAAELSCGLSEDITVDRDLPASLRLGGYALAMGIICARGAAGDWTSLQQTAIEFAVAWPIVPLTAVVIAVEKVLERQPYHYRRGMALSVMIGAAYIAAAVAVVVSSGPPPHNPQYDYLNWQ
jgi:hypothetical protein